MLILIFLDILCTIFIQYAPNTFFIIIITCQSVKVANLKVSSLQPSSRTMENCQSLVTFQNSSYNFESFFIVCSKHFFRETPRRRTDDLARDPRLHQKDPLACNKLVIHSYLCNDACDQIITSGAGQRMPKTSFLQVVVLSSEMRIPA